MFKSFVISALRNLKKNKLYAAINVFGLALGIACCLVIFIVVRFETSFDNYHTKADRIYRVNWYQETDQGRMFNGCNYSPLAASIREEVTGLEETTGVFCLQRYEFSIDSQLYEEQYAFFADSHYFNVFDVKWISGNKHTALLNPGTVVVTRKFADDYLGGYDNALNAELALHNKVSLRVSGVVENPPLNTDHPYSLLISYPTLALFQPETTDNWQEVTAGATYIVFRAETDATTIYKQLNSIIRKYLKPDQAAITKFHLLPLNDNHDRNYDYTSFNYDFPVPIMIILAIVSCMIALIACVNFVNLATAQSLTRAREVGIRKTMGSTKGALVLQYLSESLVITSLAVMVGIIVSYASIHKLNELYGANNLKLDIVQDPAILIFIVLITVIITLLSGFYPAFILSRFKPVLALKSQTSTGSLKGFTLRKTLVVLQFTAAQILILVTFIMIKQISFFKHRPIGYDPTTMLVIPYLYEDKGNERNAFYNELNNIPGIANFSFGNAGNNRVDFYIRELDKHTAIVSYADTSYLSTFNLKLLSGMNVNPPTHGSSPGVVVNESLIDKLGLTSPASAVGTIFTLGDQEVVIQGVVNNTYTNPMSNTIDPLIIRYDPEQFVAVVIDLSTKHFPQTLTEIERAWQRVYPNYLFRFTFMDDSIDREYGFYNLIFGILGIASFLAMFIGCLGLYGLVSFMALQRTKEIGIRKVLGATVTNILEMFTKETLVLLFIAFMFASPLAYLVGMALLTEFPQKVSPGPGIFLFTLLGSVAIALSTVTYRSFLAAIKNPADSLRAE